MSIYQIISIFQIMRKTNNFYQFFFVFSKTIDPKKIREAPSIEQINLIFSDF